MRTLYIDAVKNDFFTETSPMTGAHHTGTVWTWYNGFRNDIITYRLAVLHEYMTEEQNRNLYCIDFVTGASFKDWNNNWVENSTKTGASAFWSLEKSFDYFFARFGRAGSDHSYKVAKVKIETPTYGMGTNPSDGIFYHTNAAYDDIRIRMNNTSIAPPDGVNHGHGYSAARLELIAHEYTHALIYPMSGLGSLNTLDAMSLNEGFADIFAIATERFVNGYPDWTFGEQSGSYLRHFANPGSDTGPGYPSASIYLQPPWSSFNQYVNSGVLRKWFYLLVNGGTFNGVTVQPLGFTVAENIAYHAMTWWLWSNISYPQAANRIVDGAKDLYGFCSNAHKQTANAFKAVGFSVTVPFCGIGTFLSGPSVVGTEETNISFEAHTGDAPLDPNGVYQWQIPETWEATASGNILTLHKVTDTSSRELAVTYISPEHGALTAQKIVHFSDQPVNQVLQTSSAPLPALLNGQMGNLADTRFYPNPANQLVHVILPAGIDNVTLSIMDMSGRTLIQQTIAKGSLQLLDVSSLPNGIYAVALSSENNQFIHKLSIAK